jgi:hypothetical protein
MSPLQKRGNFWSGDPPFAEHEKLSECIDPTELKFSLIPLRLPFRHARVAGRLQLRIIEQAG